MTCRKVKMKFEDKQVLILGDPLALRGSGIGWFVVRSTLYITDYELSTYE